MIGTTAINRIIVLTMAAAVLFLVAFSPFCGKTHAQKASPSEVSANYKPGQRAELLGRDENIDIKKIIFNKYHLGVFSSGSESSYIAWAVLFAFFYSGIIFLLRRFNYIIVSIGKRTSILALSIGGNSPPASYSVL